MVDPFQTTTPFDQQVIDEILSDPLKGSKKKQKVGVFVQSQFLPVSKSVKRAMQMTKDALESQGFEVVPFKVTEEEFALGRKYLLGIATGTLQLIERDLIKYGEPMQLDNWVSFFLVNRSPQFRWCLHKLMSVIGMERGVKVLKHVKYMAVKEYQQLLKDRMEFAFKFSKKW